MDIELAVRLLNSAVPWADLGFVVDGRFVFSQRTLQTALAQYNVIFSDLAGIELNEEEEWRHG